MKNLPLQLFLLIILFYNFLYPQWEEADNGLSTSVIKCVYGTPAQIFLGTGGKGIYYSNDTGKRWERINDGLTNFNINTLIENNNYLFAASDEGIFVSSNAGKLWDKPDNRLRYSTIYSLAALDNKIFAGTHGEGIFISTDNGSNWKEVSSGIPEYSTILSMAVCGNEIFAGTYGNGIYKSTDMGLSWNAVNNGLLNTNIFSMAVYDNKLYAGTNSGYIYITSDKGINWQIYSNNLYTDGNILSIAVNDKLIIIASEDKLLYLSTDFGISWQSISAGWGIDGLASNVSIIGDYIFAGTTDKGILMSADLGKNWKKINQTVKGMQVTLLRAIDDKLFAGGNGVIFLSYDYGINWQPMNEEINPLYIKVLETDSLNLIGGGIGIYMSSDLGISWNRFEDFWTSEIRTIAASNDFIFAGTRGYGIYFSSDNGSNWKEALQYPTYLRVNSMKIIGNNIFAGSNDSGVIISSDFGFSWNTKNIGLPSLLVNVIGFIENKAIITSKHKTFFSTDLGITWIETIIGNINFWLDYILVFGNNVIASGYSENLDKIYMSTDLGKTWNKRDGGILSYSVGPLEKCGEYIFAASDGGVFRAKISDIITDVPGETDQNSNVSLFISPNPATSQIVISGLGLGVGKIDIYNLMGEVMKSQTLTGSQSLSQSVDVSALPPGIYFVKAAADSRVETATFVKLD